jgi:hypothetical protein
VTVAETIQALGGATAVSRVCRVSLAAVCNWVSDGKIPPAHHAALWRMAQARGVDWTPPGFEGVRLVLVESEHAREDNVTAKQDGRECSVKFGDAA